ncbi:MAG TPA: alpha/beta hydrolase [Chitinophagaceae bacterium]|nr:alpha/beta hydrolase [Chitinophagaceae bacterium]
MSKRTAAARAFRLFCTPQYRNRKKIPKIFQQAEPLSFSFEGSTVRGYRTRNASDKKLLILHGFESSVINFDRYVKPAVAKGYQVLAFDAPAHGRSSGRMINALIYKKLVQQIVATYGPIQTFIGHSLGGLALGLTLEDLPHDASTKAVFIAPATETPSAIDSFFRFLHLDASVRKEFDRVIEEKSGHPPSWFSLRRIAPKLKAEVLWLHDRGDEMTPFADVEPVMQLGLENFRFITTEGLGHRRIYRDNKCSRAIVDFI